MYYKKEDVVRLTRTQISTKDLMTQTLTTLGVSLIKASER